MKIPLSKIYPPVKFKKNPSKYCNVIGEKSTFDVIAMVAILDHEQSNILYDMLTGKVRAIYIMWCLR